MRTLVIALVFSVLTLATSAPAQTATLTMLPEGFEVYDLSGDGRVVVGWVINVTSRRWA